MHHQKKKYLMVFVLLFYVSPPDTHKFMMLSRRQWCTFANLSHHGCKSVVGGLDNAKYEHINFLIMRWLDSPSIQRKYRSRCDASKFLEV